MDLAKLVSLVTSRAAVGVAVVAVTAGAGGAVALTSHPASSHQSQTVLSVDSSSSSSPESAETDTDSSHSLNSADSSTTNHGDVVTRAVSSCKASASAAHEHGIGQCVSEVASTNGEAHRNTTSHSTSESTTSH